MTSNRVCRAAHKPQSPVANLYATPAGQRIDNSVSVPNAFSCGGGSRRGAVGEPRKSPCFGCPVGTLSGFRVLIKF